MDDATVLEVFAELAVLTGPPAVCDATELPAGRPCDRAVARVASSWCAAGCAREFLACEVCAAVIAQDGSRCYCLRHPGAVLHVGPWRVA